jgi:formate dehydrogenase subunit beta
MIRSLWQITDGDGLDATRDVLRALFDRQIVDALLVPVEGAQNSVMPALVKHPARLDRANPLAPVMAFNSARLAAMLTRDATNAKIGVVLRSCEIRALIELVKFNQAKLDQTVLIGIDCVGTYAPPAYMDALRESPHLTAQMLDRARRGEGAGFEFRRACAMCEYPAPPHADIAIGFIGVANAAALAVELRDDIAARMGLVADSSAVPSRDAALAKLVAARIAVRDAALKHFRERMRGDGGLANYLAECLECTNCMTACPMCYCKECFFRTDNAARTPRELLRLSERQGALTMPPDALLFQMTRLNHMATSCVGCGMCETACPHHIPLTVMFRAVGARVQKLFDYVPGRDVSAKPPFMEFKRDELPGIGETNQV